MAKHVVGYYDTEAEAIEAVEELKRQGYSAQDISIISKNVSDVDAISNETGANAMEGAITGVAAGGTLGGLGGVIVGLGALAIPGIGPVVAAGPIAAGLTGLATGVMVGGIVGALIGMGIPEDEAERYNEQFEAGKILIMVAEDKRGSGTIS